jgi:hypothetical protein
MDFQSKVVVVTGAGAGIGLAAALAFGKQGARVALVDASAENGQAAQRTLQGAGVETLLALAAVQDSAQVQQVVDQVAQKWGRLDVLVNNAGIYTQGNALETSEADWDRIIAVNLTGPYLMAKSALPLMLKTGGGVIVNVASEAGLVGIKNQVAYNVSKAGLIGFTRSCAVDFASMGVRVNAVCPGTTDTPLVQAAVRRAADPAAARRELESIRPLNRLGRVEEIASAILFMASDEAGYATGSILSIDGGYTAQ